MPDSHGQGHDHDRGPAQGPLADASVRRAGVNDAPAVGYVQAEVWRAAYEGKVPAEVTSASNPSSASRFSATRAAMGERQMLPQQTKTTLTLTDAPADGT